MRTTILERKALGYDILIKLISLCVVFISYFYALAILDGEINNPEFLHLQFIKNAFVFIVPAGLEGMNIFISVEQENKAQDKLEVFLSVACVAVGVFLFIASMFNGSDFYAFFQFAILAYPVRIFSSLVFDFMKF